MFVCGCVCVVKDAINNIEVACLDESSISHFLPICFEDVVNEKKLGLARNSKFRSKVFYIFHIYAI